MREDSKYRLDSALNMIKAVYSYVDAGIRCEDPGIMKQAYEGLLNTGKNSREARRIVAREAFAGVRPQDDGYLFCEQAALEQVAGLSVSLMN